MQFFIEQAPDELSDEVKAYLERMFRNINHAINEVVPKLNTMPHGAQDGSLYYFSVVIRPEITQIGFWGKEAGLWVKL